MLYLDLCLIICKCIFSFKVSYHLCYFSQNWKRWAWTWQVFLFLYVQVLGLPTNDYFHYLWMCWLFSLFSWLIVMSMKCQKMWGENTTITISQNGRHIFYSVSKALYTKSGHSFFFSFLLFFANLMEQRNKHLCDAQYFFCPKMGNSYYTCIQYRAKFLSLN